MGKHALLLYDFIMYFLTIKLNGRKREYKIQSRKKSSFPGLSLRCIFVLTLVIRGRVQNNNKNKGWIRDHNFNNFMETIIKCAPISAEGWREHG